MSKYHHLLRYLIYSRIRPANQSNDQHHHSQVHRSKLFLEHKLTRLLWVQLVVSQQDEAPSFQQTLFDVKAEPSPLESDQLLPPRTCGAVQPEVAHIQGFTQEPEPRRTLSHRIQLQKKMDIACEVTQVNSDTFWMAYIILNWLRFGRTTIQDRKVHRKDSKGLTVK